VLDGRIAQSQSIPLSIEQSAMTKGSVIGLGPVVRAFVVAVGVNERPPKQSAANCV
jgi:hypothetical protein